MASWEQDAVLLFKSGHDVEQIAEKYGTSEEEVESVIRTWMIAYEAAIRDAQPAADGEGLGL